MPNISLEKIACTWCGAEMINIPQWKKLIHRKTGRLTCSRSCGMLLRDSKPRKKRTVIPIETACTICQKPMFLTNYREKSRFQKTGRAYCSRSCSSAYQALVSSKTMTRTNKKYASERMKQNNPMHRQEIRRKVSTTLKEMGHSPKLRGGNGRPPTEAEIKLYELFYPSGFKLQTIVKTGCYRGTNGYPSHYKIDCGHINMKIAIEADGLSHSTLNRQEQDRKKEQYLTGLGWKVFRFTNREILENPEMVLSTILKWMISILSPRTV